MMISIHAVLSKWMHIASSSGRCLQMFGGGCMLAEMFQTWADATLNGPRIPLVFN